MKNRLYPVYGRLRIKMEDDLETPVMVYCRTSDGLLSATYHCVWNESEVDGEPLNDREMDWINAWFDQADSWYNDHRVLS